MLWLDIVNCVLTSIVIYLTSVSGENKIPKKKLTAVKARKKNCIIIILSLAFIGQVWTLFVNSKDRKEADCKINQLHMDIITYQKRVDTALMQRDTTIRFAQKTINAFLDSLEKHGIHYDREKGMIEVNYQPTTVNQYPAVNFGGPTTNLQFHHNQFSNDVHIDNTKQKKHR